MLTCYLKIGRNFSTKLGRTEDLHGQTKKLFRKFHSKQLQLNLLISYFTMFNAMYSSISSYIECTKMASLLRSYVGTPLETLNHLSYFFSKPNFKRVSNNQPSTDFKYNENLKIIIYIF